MVATWGQTSLQKPLRHHARHRRQGCSRPPPTTWRSLFSMCSLIRTAPLFPPISVALLLLFQVPSATAQIHALSSSFQRARLCLAAGGILDLYGHDYGGLEGPYCLSSGSCPAGSVQIEQQCVAPNAGQPREIALTIHVPCNSCVYDSGVELSGHLWLAVSRMLRVPVQETAAGVLIMRSDMRSVYPVEHFTLAPRDASPMVDGPGRLGPVTLSRDLLLAFRIHTSRVPSNSYALQALRHRPTPSQSQSRLWLCKNSTWAQARSMALKLQATLPSHHVSAHVGKQIQQQLEIQPLYNRSVVMPLGARTRAPEGQLHP